MRHLRQSSSKLEGITAHLRSLHPLSPLQRGFALLQVGDRLLNNDESLTAFAKVEIVRRSEIAQVVIKQVTPTIIDKTNEKVIPKKYE